MCAPSNIQNHYCNRKYCVYLAKINNNLPLNCIEKQKTIRYFAIKYKIKVF